MPLNIKDPETERLAAEIAAMTGDTKTGAIRRALRERKRRLLLEQTGGGRGDRMVAVLERSLWPHLDTIAPRPLTAAEEDAILGYGPDGV